MTNNKKTAIQINHFIKTEIIKQTEKEAAECKKNRIAPLVYIKYCTKVIINKEALRAAFKKMTSQEPVPIDIFIERLVDQALNKKDSK